MIIRQKLSLVLWSQLLMLLNSYFLMLTCHYVHGLVSNYLGRTVTVPVVKCFIRCPFDVGESCKRSYQVVFTGSIPGVKDHNSPDSIANNCYYNLIQLLKMCKQLKLDLVD